MSSVNVSYSGSPQDKIPASTSCSSQFSFISIPSSITEKARQNSFIEEIKGFSDISN